MRDIPPDRWRRIDTVFSGALEMDARDRPGYLDRVCGEDTELRNAVQALLSVDDEAEEVLGEHAADLAGGLIRDFLATTPDPAEDDVPPGTRLGPYEVVREIGRGGMGRVYLAERADRAFEKRVALKLVKRGMDTDEILRRFRHERQILASLEHPGIARLLDGGVAPDGRPYLVMELVEGTALDRWIEEEDPRVEARLRLFLRVCDAVQHAHRRLVVHRDLKPGNVLVTPGGEPRLLDFGIAKLLSDDEGAPRTRTGFRVVTPELAAPEQLRGEPVGTACDVHGLGVLLYVLLTGRRPWDGVRRTGARDDPSPEAPSSAAGTDALRRRLRGELDLITLRALHPDPERRYDSAAALAEDVRRHLEGRPVLARPDSAAYRLRKFVGRHRAAVAASAVALLLVGVAGTFAVRERVERAREREASLAVSAFLEQLFEASDPFEGGGERLDTLRAFDLLRRAEAAMGAELAANPRVRARLLHTLGKVHLNAGHYERGDSLLREAVELRRTNGEPASALGTSLVFLGRSALERGQPDEAEPRLREALALGEQLEASDRAAALTSLGAVHVERGDTETADSVYRRALEAFRSAPGTEIHQANVLGNLSFSALRRGDLEAALPLTAEALELYRAHAPPGHPGLARAVNNRAVALRMTGNPEEALPLYRESLEQFERSLRPPHPMRVLARMNLSTALTAVGRTDEAEGFVREGVREAREAWPPGHPQLAETLLAASRFLAATASPGAQADDGDRPRTAEAAPEAGDVATGAASEVDGDRIAEAMALGREGLEMAAGSLPADHPLVAEGHMGLGHALTLAGRWSEAEDHLLRGWRILEGNPAAPPAARSRTAELLVELYEAWGRPERAEPYREAAAPAS